MVAMRENEERSRMLGYDPFRVKLLALGVSGLYAGRRGRPMRCCSAMSAPPSPRSSIRSCRCSTCCSGGAGTVIGPFLGTLAMFYLIDLASGYTSAHLLVVGVALVVLVLFAPKGHARARCAKGGCRWLP
jgi:branched-chain amino acid transport system permease protein